MIQRAIEESGIPTVGVVNMKDKADRVGLPRAVSVKFPRGATLGPPHQAELHRRILRDALHHLETATEPAPAVELDHRWKPNTMDAAPVGEARVVSEG